MNQQQPVFASEKERLENVWRWRKARGLTGKVMKQKFNANFNPVVRHDNNVIQREGK